MASPTQTAFEGWSQYLQQEDFDYLIQYIENIQNGIPNNEMIILLGLGRNGKTTLKHEICTYLGEELCGYMYDRVLHELIYEENIKPFIIFQEGDIYRTEQNNKSNKKLINSLINFIRYGISFITILNDVDTVNQKILEHSKIIMMTHIFPIQNTL
jgi:hypothetical protein